MTFFVFPACFVLRLCSPPALFPCPSAAKFPHRPRCLLLGPVVFCSLSLSSLSIRSFLHNSPVRKEIVYTQHSLAAAQLEPLHLLLSNNMEVFLQGFSSLPIVSDNAASPPVSRTSTAEKLPALSPYPKGNKTKKHHPRRRIRSRPLHSRWESDGTAKPSKPTATVADQRWMSEVNTPDYKATSSQRTGPVRQGSSDLMPRMPSRRHRPFAVEELSCSEYKMAPTHTETCSVDCY